MKARHLVLATLLIGATALLWFGERKPDAVVAAVERSADKPGSTNTAPALAPAPSILALRSRNEAGADRHGGAGKSLFAMHSWAPPPPPPVEVKAPPPPKPTAPPVPFIYLGKKFENGRWEAYLARGNDTFIVQEQSLIDNQYRAERIAPPLLTITYLPLKTVQTIAIGEGE